MLDLGRTFLQSAERSPQAIALVDGDTRLSYADWALRIGAAQRGLQTLGLGRGDHLLSILQNRVEAATLHWACQFAGIVMTPLNWRAKPEEIDHVLVDSGARVVVFEPVSAVAVGEAVHTAGVMRVALDGGSDGPAEDGHPARAAGLARLLDHMGKYDGVWVTRRIDIARHWIATHPYPGHGLNEAP